MYIREKRIKNEIDNIIKENLMNGQLPTSKEVISELSTYIAMNNLNVPSYKFYKIYVDFTLDVLNNAQEKITKDLAVVYDSILDLYQLGDKQVEKFEWERKKHTYMFNKLEADFMDLALIESSSIYKEIYTDKFIDREGIDENSTCDINIEHKEATLKKLRDKLYTKRKTVRVSYPNELEDVDITRNGDIEELIDVKGINWNTTIRKRLEARSSVLITVTLDEIESLNRMVLYAPMLKNTSMIVKTTKDMDEWINYGSFDIQDRANISFLDEFRVLTIELIKEEADKYVDNLFEYIYLVDTIELFTTNYAKKSTMLSKVIKFENNVDKVILDVDEFLPAGTEIKHYLAINEPQPEWIEINPREPLSFNTVLSGNEKIIELSPDLSDTEYKMGHLTTYGQELYSITPRGLTEENIIYNNLYKGVDSWKKETLNTTIFGAPKINMFKSINSAIEYQPVIKKRSGLILNSKTFDEVSVIKYSTTIERRELSQAIKRNIITNVPVSIYLNGQRIFSDDNLNGKIDQPVIYYFRKGQNILDIIINVNKTNEGETANVSLDLQLDLYGLSTSIYAEPKAMKEISLFNLRYNSNNQNDVYAITRTNSGQEIVVKNNDLSIKYLFKYDYITNKQTELLFKAVLSREYISTNVSPRLISYSLKII